MSDRGQNNGHEKQNPGRSGGSESPDLPDALEDNSFFTSANASRPKKRRFAPLIDHFNAKDLKELFKCSMAVWILTIFIFIKPILRAEGQAMFFGW